MSNELGKVLARARKCQHEHEAHVAAIERSKVGSERQARIDRARANLVKATAEAQMGSNGIDLEPLKAELHAAERDADLAEVVIEELMRRLAAGVEGIHVARGELAAAARARAGELGAALRQEAEAALAPLYAKASALSAALGTLGSNGDLVALCQAGRALGVQVKEPHAGGEAAAIAEAARVVAQLQAAASVCNEANREAQQRARDRRLREQRGVRA